MDDASPTATGASNASDFQPPTQNPQDSTPNLQPVSNEGSAGRLDQLPAETLTVETVQSGSTSQIPSASLQPGTNSFTGFLPVLVILVIAVLLFRRWNLFSPQPNIELPSETAAVSTEPKPKKPTKKQPKAKPKAKKKSKSKR
jgi:hypothetical protein